MALRINTQIAGDVFILLCDGRIVFGDEDGYLARPGPEYAARHADNCR